MSIALIILAAGKGTRMRSDLPKVLHEIAGAPMLAHAMRTGHSLKPERTIVVAGHGADQVTVAAQAVDPNCEIVLQTQQLGTGHAVDQARAALAGFEGTVVVLYGDTPLISPETLSTLTTQMDSADVAVLGFHAADAGRYGRLVTQGDTLEKIVEFKDATPQERAIDLCNSGVMAVKAATLFEMLSKTNNDNASGEYYLTDVVGHARDVGMTCKVVTCPEAETLGVNSRVELAQAEAIFQKNARLALLESGVTMPAPETVYLSHDTQIGVDTIIEPNVVFGTGVTVEGGAQIRAFSHLEGAHVCSGAVIGPYARLRPGAHLGQDTRVGNFVEIKKASIGTGAKVNHLSYVGDATIGARSNLGAGTITCNYDGFMKHQTIVGEDVFIGSNTMLVAPVTVGDNAMTASGSVITKSVEADALALARADQVNKPSMAKKLKDRLRAIKAKKNKGA